MTCRLMLLRDGVATFLDYWTQTRADCIEMAALWRLTGASVWMEWFR